MYILAMEITMAKYVTMPSQISSELSKKRLQPVRHRCRYPHQLFDVILTGHIHLSQEESRRERWIHSFRRSPLEINQQIDRLPVPADPLFPIGVQQVVQRSVADIPLQNGAIRASDDLRYLPVW